MSAYNKFTCERIEKLSELINSLLNVSEVAIKKSIDEQFKYYELKADLQSDIRNPLSVIKGSVFMLRKFVTEERRQDIFNYIEKIESAVNNIESII